MPPALDWEFPEDPEPSERSVRDGVAPGGRRWLLRGAILLLIIVAIGLAIRMWVNSRLDAVERAEAELKSFVALELKTIADGDLELFRALQDPDDARWQALQVARYQNERGGFAPVPGLALADRAPEIRDVQVVGRDGRAELAHWYNAPAEAAADPVSFRVTWFYRQADDGVWFHVPPPMGYGGIPHSWHGAHLDLYATDADAELFDPIARDLATLVLEGCRHLGCPAEQRFALSFDRELAPVVREAEWKLPAIQLTGAPEGEDAREVWLGALKAWIVESLARSRVGGQYLTDRVIYRQLVARLRGALGVASLPVIPDRTLLAQALRDGRVHPFYELWEAPFRPEIPDQRRLLDTEVALLLQWLEAHAGAERVLGLLSMLDGFSESDLGFLRESGMAVHQDLEAEWFSYLFEQAGISAIAAPSAGGVADSPELPQPLPALPAVSDNQLAFVCGDQIWAGNVDGSRTVLMTGRNDRFRGLFWSPDGRWLLTSRLADPARDAGGRGAAYLLAADGSGASLLTNDPTLTTEPIGWSPDGREVIYHVWRKAQDGSSASGVWATTVETARTRSLPGRPIWSPDGAHVILFENATGGSAGAVWLADAEWRSVRRIAERAWIGVGDVWAPDSSKSAITLDRFDAKGAAVALYDVNLDSLNPLIVAGDLTAIEWSLAQGLTAGDAGPYIQPDEQFSDLWPAGWSADGSSLYVWAQATSESAEPAGLTVLVDAPLGKTPLRVLARGRGASLSKGSRSLANSGQVILGETGHNDRAEELSTPTGNVTVGEFSPAPPIWNASWSPDGLWAASAGEGGVTIVDKLGNVHDGLHEGDDCSDVAWNPSADLSALSRSVDVALLSATDGWQFDKVRVRHDPFGQSVHAWGEVVNGTGESKRIVAFVPVLQDGAGILNVEQPDYVLGQRELFSSADLAAEASLPFGMTFNLPQGTQLQEDARIIVHVVVESGEPTNEDLRIAFNEYDLIWPISLRVSGEYEQSGRGYDKYIAIIVTAFGLDGQLMGWDWQHITDPVYLSMGRHPFDVTIEFSPHIVDLNLDIAYYKIQIFGR